MHGRFTESLPSPHEQRPMKTLILCGLTTIGFILGAAIGMRFPHSDLAIPLTCAMVGSLMGMIVGETLLHLIGSRRRRPIRIPGSSQVRTRDPAPFQTRLAAFARCDQDVMQAINDRASSMPFWRATDELEPTPPRTPSALRPLLFRIREILVAHD